MRSSQIFITGDFDGGNPKDKNSIKRIENNVFEIIPYSEDNDPNYKFRLDVKAINRSSYRQHIYLIINWQEPEFHHLRDYLYIKSEQSKEWVHLGGDTNELNTKFQLSLEPGENYICLHPKYNYEDYINYVNSISISDKIKKELIGYTPEGRKIWLVKITRKNKNPEKRILFISRIHPYETAGSYNAEGIINYFMSNFNPENRNDLSQLASCFNEFEINVIPMANPDGVFNGLTKRTSPNGIDLSKHMEISDGTCSVLMKAIDTIKPHIYVELHNWMFKERDGIYNLNWFYARKFTKHMPSQHIFNKQWAPIFKYKFLSTEYMGLKKYVKEEYGSKCACFEYPWFNRTVNHMRQIGYDTLKAVSVLF